MQPEMIVTIDGPAGVGKSTLAAHVAEHLQLPMLDSGAMFRYIASKLGERQLSDADLARALEPIRFALQGSGTSTELLCDGVPAGPELRTPEVAMLASTWATREPVRRFLLARQREIARNGGLVAEGRDMGTVVFPDAPYKFFLEATPEIRARRRWLQGGAKGDQAALVQEIMKRDMQDRKRELAPLRPAQDARIIDTSNLSEAEVLQEILSIIRP